MGLNSFRRGHQCGDQQNHEQIPNLDFSERSLYPEPVKKRKKNPAAVALGQMGGKKIAERGPEYFRKLQEKRKHFRGGRPAKHK